MNKLKKWIESKSQTVKDYFVNRSQIKVVHHFKPKKCIRVGLLLILEDGRLASKNDEYIVIFDPNNSFKEDFKFYANKFGVTCISRYKDNQMFTGGNDGKIRLWKIYKNASKEVLCITSLNNCSSLLKILVLSNNRLLVSSVQQIEIWNLNQLNNYQFIKLINFNNSGAYYIENKEILVSSPHNSKSDKICFFSMKTYQIVCHLQGVHIYLNRNFCKYDEDRLIISGFNHISMINISKYFVEWKVMIPEMYSRSIVKINDNVLIGTYRDGNLVKLNLKTKEYLFIRKIHNEWINHIDRFGKDLFMSCAGSIRIWRYEGKD